MSGAGRASRLISCFFFQAEDGIRDKLVTGVQTCALPISDGWDRGDPALVEAETARLRRSCHRLVWLNPLAGTAGYQPLAAGMRAAFPYIDDFLPAGSIASLERLGEILAGVRASDPDRGREAAAHLAPDLGAGANANAFAARAANAAQALPDRGADPSVPRPLT